MEPKSLHHFCFFLLFASLFYLIISCNEVSSKVISSTCNGSIAECNEEYEELMESEISRRFLEQKKYITPGALKKDQPVCNGGASGQAYSSSGCLPPSSNPYDRGCSKIYRCRSDS